MARPQDLYDGSEAEYAGICARMPAGVSTVLAERLSAWPLRRARAHLDAAAAALEGGDTVAALRRIAAAAAAIGNHDGVASSSATHYAGVGLFVGRRRGLVHPSEREGSDPAVLDIAIGRLPGGTGDLGRLHLVLPVGAGPGRYALEAGDATWTPDGEEVPWTLVGGWVHVVPAGPGSPGFVAAFEFDVTDGDAVLEIRCGGVAF